MLQSITVSLDIKSVLGLAISSINLYLLTRGIYNAYFHPLSRFPGPIAHAVSRLPYCYRAANGTLPFDMLELHKTYGDIVRIAPDELAFSHPDAWKDIMGHKNGVPEMGKAAWFHRPVEQSLHIVNEDNEEHRQLRRQMAHGFSEKGMRDQEPMIRKYVDILLEKLHEGAKLGKSLVLSDWYNFTTFDIIGDLAFGEPFGCLEGSNYDGWIQSIFDSGRLGTILQALSFYPSLKRLLLSLVPQSLKDAQKKHKDLTKAKMLRRMAITKERHDLIEGLLKRKDELELNVEKLVANAKILIIGGSETTASLLSGVTYLLLTNPEAYENLKGEVRSTFKSQDDINLISVNKLPYMLACLDEGMRMYPPIANGLPRVCPQGGCTVLGEYIPEDTYLSIHQWALYRRHEYFKEPNTYHPERWMGDPRFESDRRDAFQPFHLGPRNCLGRNLAYSEMRLILALIIYNFDMKIADESRGWIIQKNFLLWQKGPLKVYLTPRTEAS
ncbi:cytochrome P450 monooxygenase [Penicillium cinerascens]|uniref:Cytochrome P450 monooxygenase n=1 Tax=Penicillium cinerascens TaxID=70096 RepID=A0A9W9MP52_9EURO|nr:cytochrome P450 monooxygenase [Penicillium cinerascens]KAJ5204915.1 cytochrome P450 monooxygenase [Penicillium cinerascens]